MKQVNEHQEECLNILQEECAEVIQAASKIKRFGLVGKRETDTLTNLHHLEIELGDVLALVDLCLNSSLGLSRENIQLAKTAKLAKLPRYMHTWESDPELNQ